MSEPKTNAKVRHALRNAAAPAALMCLFAASVAFAQSAPQPVTGHRAHKPHAAQFAQPQTPSPEQPAAPPQPETPKWPANDAPSQPSITWNSQGLHIEAANASLSQILNQVSSETGAKVEGLSGDERVFGDFGPGQPRDVLSQLLHGSGYNFLLLGTQDGPLRVILSTRRTTTQPGQTNQGYNRQMPVDAQQDDENPPDPEPEEQPPFQPQRAPGDQNNPNGNMTPQQRMQMMQQQRLQQMQQMQQQYQQQQQQQQQQQPQQ